MKALKLHNYKAEYTDNFTFIVTAEDENQAEKMAIALQPSRELKSIELEYYFE